MKRKLLGVILAGTVAMSGGCAARVAHVTDLPAGVTEQQAKNWDAAVAGLHKLATLTTTLRQGVITARGAGVFPDDHVYAAALVSIGRIDQAQIEAADFLKQQPKNFGAPVRAKLFADLNTISQELVALNQVGAADIKNSDSQKNILAIIAEITATANLVLNLTF
jgi:hypothetical protein